MAGGLSSEVVRTRDLARLYENAPVGLGYLDTDLRFRYINQSLARIHGIPADQHDGKVIGKLFEAFTDELVADLREVLETGKPIIDRDIGLEMHTGPGTPRSYSHSFYPDWSANNKVSGINCVVQDVTACRQTESSLVKSNSQLETDKRELTSKLAELKRTYAETEKKATSLARANSKLVNAKLKLQRLSLHDTLTGLGNRDLFSRQLELLIAIAERRAEQVALLILDLDGFRAVNEKLGQAAGDEILRLVGLRVRKALSPADEKYRIDGNVFAVLLEPRRDVFDDAVVVAEQIAKRIAEPIEIKKHSCSLGVSMGLAIFPKHGREPKKLLRKALAAVHAAKKNREVLAGSSDLQSTTVLKSLQSDLFQLIYVTAEVEPMSETELVDSLRKASASNEELRITGMRLYKDGNFIEVLEGDETSVRKAFSKIEADGWHKNVDVLRSENIPFRNFPDWTMGFEFFDSASVPAFTRFLERDFTPEYFAEDSVESHAMLLAFKGVSLTAQYS